MIMKLLGVKVICCDQNMRCMCMSNEMGTWVEANKIKDDFTQV